MVANAGVVDLLANFACSASARGLDTSNVLVFTSDEETGRVASDLGLTAFDATDAFGAAPKSEARAYGDAVFAAMMYIKVVAVHLVSQLGYNVLFQDVDVVWFQDAVESIKSQGEGEFDAYFTDDGARSKVSHGAVVKKQHLAK